MLNDNFCTSHDFTKTFHPRIFRDHMIRQISNSAGCADCATIINHFHMPAPKIIICELIAKKCRDNSLFGRQGILKGVRARAGASSGKRNSHSEGAEAKAAPLKETKRRKVTAAAARAEAA